MMMDLSCEYDRTRDDRFPNEHAGLLTGVAHVATHSDVVYPDGLAHAATQTTDGSWFPVWPSQRGVPDTGTV